jgi:hypothetical protein
MSNKRTCPDCGAIHNLEAPIKKDGRLPEPGDICFCVTCFAVCRFDNNMELINLTEEEVDNLIELRPLDILNVIKTIFYYKFIYEYAQNEN